jgi:hypothetical protein
MPKNTDPTGADPAPMHKRGGRRREQMVGDVATVGVEIRLLPHQAAWLKDRAAGRGVSASAIVRLMIDAAMGQG